jgi:flagellar basal body-associated protein FliL
MDKAVVQEKGAGKWGRERWRLGVVAAALVLAVAACAAWFLFRHSASTAPPKAKAKPQVRAVLHLEPFVVNLADAEGDRFLRVGIDLGLEQELGEHNRAGQSEMPMARTRDTILMILTTCKADGLMAPAGKASLKDELTKALRERVPELGAREVYFTEFLVQR